MKNHLKKRIGIALLGIAMLTSPNYALCKQAYIVDSQKVEQIEKSKRDILKSKKLRENVYTLLGYLPDWSKDEEDIWGVKCYITKVNGLEVNVFRYEFSYEYESKRLSAKALKLDIWHEGKNAGGENTLYDEYFIDYKDYKSTGRNDCEFGSIDIYVDSKNRKEKLGEQKEEKLDLFLQIIKKELEDNLRLRKG